MKISRLFFIMVALVVGTVIGAGCGGGSGGESKTATYYLDADVDGYGDPDTSKSKELKTSKAVTAFNGQISVTDDDGKVYADDDDDCDDTDANVNPGMTEVGDNDKDDNCDGTEEESENLTTGTDADGDGYYAEDNDCDDGNASINPEISETCGNSVDEDCSGTADDGCSTDATDADGDGYYAEDNDCDDGNASINPKASETCGNSIDEDCSGTADDGCTTDADGDGYSSDLDCDDSNPAVNVKTVFYFDTDADGFGDPASTIELCEIFSGYSADNTDCDDTDANINPGQQEGKTYGNSSDGKDNDCDGTKDELLETSLKITTPSDIGGAKGIIGKKEEEDEAPEADTPEEEVATTIDWGVTALWRGAAWEYNDDIWMDLAYNELKSYITDITKTGLDDSREIDFTLKTNLDSGTVNYNYKYKAYYNGIAFNKKYMQVYSQHVTFPCGDEKDSTGYTYFTGNRGQCKYDYAHAAKNAEIDLVKDADFDANWLEGKKAAIVLRGFKMDYGPDNEENRPADLIVSAALEKDGISSTDHTVNIVLTSNFDDGTHTDNYEVTIFYTVIVYDPDYVTYTAVEDETYTKNGTSYESSTQALLSGSSLPSSVDNVFIGLKSWGFNQSSNMLFHRIKAYGDLQEDSYKKNGSSATVDVKWSGEIYRKASGTETEAVRDPDNMTARVFACKDSTVCKADEDWLDWKSYTVSGTDTTTGETGRTINIIGLSTTE